MSKYTPLIIAACIIFLTGCWDQRIFEKTGFALQVGVESGENGELLFTHTQPVFDPDVKENVELITTEGNLLIETREKSRRQSSKVLEGGKIQLVYFSDELARKGIHHLLEFFERSAANPLLANVVVVDGSPREMSEALTRFKNKPRPGFYVNQLLESSRRDAYTPETRIYRFDIDYFAEGIDPITPRVRLIKDAVEVTGTALFSGDKMVGEINTKWTGLLLAMRNEKKVTEFVYPEKSLDSSDGSGKKGIALLVRGTDSKIDVGFKDGIPAINISLKMEATVSEYRWDQMEDDAVQKQLEEKISQSISDECNKLIKYIQEIGSDPIGLGEIIRSKYNSYWNSVDWKDIYREAEITASAKVEISRYGTIN